VKGERVSEEMGVAELAGAMTAPDANGKIHAKRAGPKGLLPSTWLNRSVKIESTGSMGTPRETSGVLLDLYPFGPVLNASGVRTCLSWDSLIAVELIED
jgi:hypothetical protein